MQPKRPRRSDQAGSIDRSLQTSHRALRAGLFGLAALVSVSAAATVTSPPALDILQIQRLAYPGGAVPPEALAAMKSRLVPASPLPAEKVSTDAPTGSSSITATTATLADRTASEPVEAAAPAPGKSPEVEVPATADGVRAAITPATGQSAGSSLMRSPATNKVQIRDLARIYFQSESGSPVEVGGSPSAMMAPETRPGGAAVAATAERQVSGAVAEVPSADETMPRPQVATIRPDAIRELAGAYVGHAPVQAAMSPQSPVARVERPADVAAGPGVPPAPAGQAAVSTPMQQAMTSGSSAAAAKSQLPVGQPAPADPGLIAPPGSSGDKTRADAAEAAAALPGPDESSSDGNSGHRALPQAQLDTLINVFAPELRN
jgi:hypothetical protein